MGILAYSPTLYLKDTHVAICKIYILKNPFTDEIFYVGQTEQELQTRLSGHIGETGANREKINYIRQMIDSGSKPVIERVETIPTRCYIDRVMVNERELYWIKFYKDSGCSLLNKMGIDTDGTHREYRGYLSSIKKGETAWHYYFCGKTLSGQDVYDLEKLKLDGFRVSAEQIKDWKDVKINLLNDKIEALQKELTNATKFIKTEVFPIQPDWSPEFAAQIPHNDIMEDNEIDECDFECSELEGDDCDYEEDDNSYFEYDEYEMSKIDFTKLSTDTTYHKYLSFGLLPSKL